jgi:hypothetical protein
MKKLFMVAFAATALLAVSACGDNKVSFTTLEDAKSQARENAIFNAQKYRAENVLVKGWDIVARGDSTQMPDCPQGDGWATMDFVNEQKQILKVKCSTVSGATGCLEDRDFKTKPFAGEDGKCNRQIPFPLPKIAK